MAFRTAHTTTIPGGSGGTIKGVVNTKRKTFTGNGAAPAGARKVKAKTYRETPIVTTSPSGQISTQGFSTPRAAVQAKQRSQAARRRVGRIEAQQASALGFQRRERQRASQTLPRMPEGHARLTSLGAAARRPQLRAIAPSYKPPKFQGVKTAGTPSLKELQVASSSGELRTNRKGFVTTPAVRRVSSALKKAQGKGVKLTGPLTPGQKVFAKQVAMRTGLNPRVVAAQALAEESGSYATQREAEGNHNWLNIGYFDSGPGQLTHSGNWNNPRSAARSTARFLKGKEYGASEGIKAIIPESKGRGPAAQVSAIANSGWASSPTYKQSIEGTLAQIGTKGKPVPPKLLQRAKALGLGTQPNVGPAPKQVVTRYKAARIAMKEVRGTPYVWGGGHASFSASGGLDCSGAVSYVLHKAAPSLVKSPLTSGDMGSVLAPGPGAITVFYNSTHTFIYDAVKKEFWGTSVGDSGAGGLGPHAAPSKAYLAQYSVGHLPGLGQKQAVQLGGSGAAPTSFPGMTISSSGTAATIQPNAGTTQTKPGFSKSPIRLTQAQKAHRTLKELTSLGAGVGPKAEASSEDKGAVLAGLERKYGKATV